MKRLLILPLCLLTTLPACTWERTVYDEYGNPVQESEPGQEKDIFSVMEGRFDAAFSEHKNKEGVPETTSDRVSQFQKDIDSARTGGKVYGTGAFSGAGKASDLRDKRFTSSGGTFDTNKRFDTGGSSAFSRDKRPDFLNANRGLARSDYNGPMGRSDMEGRTSDSVGRTYDTHPSQYKPHTPSSYVSGREAKTPQPTIIDHRDQGKKNIDQTRHLMGRDEKPE